MLYQHDDDGHAGSDAAGRLQLQQDQDDLREVLRSPCGIRLLSRIITRSGAICGSYLSGDALGTAYNEGLRRVGLDILAEVRAVDPQAFALLLVEGTDYGRSR